MGKPGNLQGSQCWHGRGAQVAFSAPVGDGFAEALGEDSLMETNLPGVGGSWGNCCVASAILWPC